MIDGVPEARHPLFVRIPATQARRLDRLAQGSGRSKQDVVTELLAGGLSGPAKASTSPAGAAAGEPPVLTLAEAAALLRVDEASVLARIDDGDLPGRRFGDEWRFSRDAVLRWLEGSDKSRRAPGFTRARGGS